LSQRGNADRQSCFKTLARNGKGQEKIEILAWDKKVKLGGYGLKRGKVGKPLTILARAR